MATWTRREVVTRRVEYIVPAEGPYGACWAEVCKAFSAIRSDLETAGVLPELASMPDDMVRVLPGEDEILIVADLPTQVSEED